jgi:hypothetical protein
MHAAQGKGGPNIHRTPLESNRGLPQELSNPGGGFTAPQVLAGRPLTLQPGQVYPQDGGVVERGEFGSRVLDSPFFGSWWVPSRGLLWGPQLSREQVLSTAARRIALINPTGRGWSGARHLAAGLGADAPEPAPPGASGHAWRFQLERLRRRATHTAAVTGSYFSNSAMACPAFRPDPERGMMVVSPAARRPAA